MTKKQTKQTKKIVDLHVSHGDISHPICHECECIHMEWVDWHVKQARMELLNRVEGIVKQRLEDNDMGKANAVRRGDHGLATYYKTLRLEAENILDLLQEERQALQKGAKSTLSPQP